MPHPICIRPFDKETDCPAVAQVWEVVFEERVTAESLADDLARLDPNFPFVAWVAVVDGKIVGTGYYQQMPGRYHPRKFDIQVAVLPDFRRQGIGGALYEQLREALAPFDPIALGAGARESRPDAVAFLEHRGFHEKLRNWESHLDLTVFTTDAFADRVVAAEAAGYQFRAYPDLAGDPMRDQKLYEMVKVARRDIPSSEPLTDISYEHWMKGLARPTFMPESWMIALKDGQMVGVSNIWTTDDPAVLDVGVTAVLREHRGQGVAKALKVKSLAAAKARGTYRLVKTWNATTNAPMLAINDWLGFVRQPAYIAFSLQLHPEE